MGQPQRDGEDGILRPQIHTQGCPETLSEPYSSQYPLTGEERQAGECLNISAVRSLSLASKVNMASRPKRPGLSREAKLQEFFPGRTTSRPHSKLTEEGGLGLAVQEVY